MNDAVVKVDKNETEMIEMILATIGEFYKANRVYILGFSEDMCFYQIRYEWCKSGLKAIDNNRKMSYQMSKFAQSMYKNKSPYLIKDIEDIKNFDSFAYQRQKMRGVKSLYGIPFLVNDEIQGCVRIDNPTLHIGNFTLLKTLSIFICNLLSQVTVQKDYTYQIYHDVLTGLDNRNSFMNYLKTLKSLHPTQIGIAVANINRLEQINFDLGLSYGDSMIKLVAQVLAEEFLPGRVFRFEGDEFIVICPDISYSSFRDRINLAKEHLKASISNVVAIGYAWTEKKEKDIGELVHEATQAMLSNKRCYYEQLELSSRRNNIQLLLNLKKEIENGNFHVYYQPKIDSRTNQLKGMEALIRYIHPKEGVISPSNFLPILEKTG